MNEAINSLEEDQKEEKQEMFFKHLKKQMLKKSEIIGVLRERMMKTKTGRINM